MGIQELFDFIFKELLTSLLVLLPVPRVHFRLWVRGHIVVRIVHGVSEAFKSVADDQTRITVRIRESRSEIFEKSLRS